MLNRSLISSRRQLVGWLPVTKIADFGCTWAKMLQSFRDFSHPETKESIAAGFFVAPRCHVTFRGAGKQKWT